MKTIAITIDETILSRIDRLAGADGSHQRSRSNLIRKAVNEYLDRLERQSEEEREKEVFRRHRNRLTHQAVALIKEQAKP